MASSAQITRNVDIASTPLISPSPKRMGLVFTSPPTNRVTLSSESIAVLDQGLTLNPGNAPLTMDYITHGELVRRGWSAISAVAAQDITFFEIFE